MDSTFFSALTPWAETLLRAWCGLALLPHAMRYNQDAAPEAMARIRKSLGGQEAAKGLYELERQLGLPMRLADIGMKEADLERAARLAVEAPYPNPRKVEYAPVLALLRDAYEGRRPL